MLKVLYVPIGAQSGMVDAWKNVGVQLEVFDYFSLWQERKHKELVNNEFINRVRNFKPDLIFMQLQFTGIIEPSTVAAARNLSPGVVIANWTGDARNGAMPQFTEMAKVVDYSLISSTGQIDMYKKAGCHNIKYWQIGYDPKVCHPQNNDTFKYDVSFLANNYGSTFPDGNIRVSAAQHLRGVFGHKFGLFGSGYTPPAPSIDPAHANVVYNQSVCALSISNYNSVSHYFSDRLLHCLASGRPTICWYFPGCESYFVNEKDLFIVKSNKEIVDVVNYCKNNLDIAKKIGTNGYRRAVTEHTFTSRVIEFLHMSNLIHRV